jgi:hypothetical protein
MANRAVQVAQCARPSGSQAVSWAQLGHFNLGHNIDNVTAVRAKGFIMVRRHKTMSNLKNITL